MSREPPALVRQRASARVAAGALLVSHRSLEAAAARAALRQERREWPEARRSGPAAPEDREVELRPQMLLLQEVRVATPVVM